METTSPLPKEVPAMPGGELQPAEEKDLSNIRKVLQEASEFKYSQGDDIWGPKPFTDDEVGKMIASGNMFVYKVDGGVAASVLLLPNDERMWGEEQGGDNTALYVHKLNTGNAFRGQEIGKKVMKLAEDIAGKSGKTKLRLDCPYDNENLYNYYIDLGFHEVRRQDRPLSPGRRNQDKEIFKAALLEKEIAVPTN